MILAIPGGPKSQLRHLHQGMTQRVDRILSSATILVPNMTSWATNAKIIMISNNSYIY